MRRHQVQLSRRPRDAAARSEHHRRGDRRLAAQPAPAPLKRRSRAYPGRSHPGRGRRHFLHGQRGDHGRGAAVAYPPPPPHAGSLPARSLPQALLGYVLETRLARLSGPEPEVTVNSPWDLWWVSFRTAIPAGQLGVTSRVPVTSCAACAEDASAMAAADPPRHPGMTAGQRPCGCLLDWAVRMRAPAAAVTWPALPLSLALIKPGAPGQADRKSTRLE